MGSCPEGREMVLNSEHNEEKRGSVAEGQGRGDGGTSLRENIVGRRGGSVG